MKKKIYFENLDAIRFLCFLIVFLHHSFYTESAEIKSNEWYTFITRSLFNNGNLGVNFFFVLSGFLITFLLIEEKKLNGVISLKNFWIRRILRIWPLYFFCLIFGFLIFPQIKLLFGQIPIETANPWMYISFLSNFDIIYSDLPDASTLGVLWSIAIEEQFYLVWPVFLYLIPLKRLWILFVSLISISLLYRYFNYSYMNYEYHTLSCMSDLVIGSFGAWLIAFSDKFKTRIQSLPRSIIILTYAGFFAFFFFRSEFMIYISLTFERIFFSFLILTIILEQVYSKNSVIKLGKLKFLTKLGQISYGLYSLHFIAILITTILTKKLGINQELWQIILIDTPVSLLITIFISKISYTYLESPFLRLKKKFQFITK